MISRVTAVFAFSLLTIATSLGWAEETYQGQVAGVGEVEVELLERGSPVFPRRAKSYGVIGSVLVRFSVDVEGNDISSVIVESKTRLMFDLSAMRYMETLQV